MLDLIIKIDLTNKSIGNLFSTMSSIITNISSFNNKFNKNTNLKIILLNFNKFYINSEKMKKKIHFTHSKYPGSSKRISYNFLLKNKPKTFFKIILRGMLPKNSLMKKIINTKYIEINA